MIVWVVSLFEWIVNRLAVMLQITRDTNSSGSIESVIMHLTVAQVVLGVKFS